MAVLSGHDLSCSKRDRLLFSGIGFTLSPAQLLYITGPNGAGKTSLLRILVGLSEADQGSVRFNDEPIAKVQDSYYQQLVYFGHKLGLNLRFDAVQNLRHWCEQHRIETTDKKIIAILDELGLVGLESLRVGELSAGQQRRVALARFWLKSDAAIWIMDEPFTALDFEGIQLLKTRMLTHLQRRGAVILTSHQTVDIDWPVQHLQLEYRI